MSNGQPVGATVVELLSFPGHRTHLEIHCFEIPGAMDHPKDHQLVGIWLYKSLSPWPTVVGLAMWFNLAQNQNMVLEQRKSAKEAQEWKRWRRDELMTGNVFPAWLVAWPNMWLCPLSSLRRVLLVSCWRGPETNEKIPNLRLLGLSLTSFAYHAFFAECLPWPCVNRLQLCLAWSVLYSFMVHPLFSFSDYPSDTSYPPLPGRGVGAATSLAQDSVLDWVRWMV